MTVSESRADAVVPLSVPEPAPAHPRPPIPPNVDVTGNWIGTVTTTGGNEEPIGTTTTVVFRLKQTGASVTAMAIRTEKGNPYAFTGTVSGSELNLELSGYPTIPCPDNCLANTFSLAGTISTAGDEIDANMSESTSSCGIYADFSVVESKQEPTGVDVTGVWSVTFTVTSGPGVPVGTQYTSTLTLIQTGASVVGVFVPSDGGGGHIAATMSGTSMQATIAKDCAGSFNSCPGTVTCPGTEPCSGVFSFTASDSDGQLTGTGSETECEGTTLFTVAATRQ